MPPRLPGVAVLLATVGSHGMALGAVVPGEVPGDVLGVLPVCASAKPLAARVAATRVDANALMSTPCLVEA